MVVDIRLPNITADSTDGQILQIRSYLTQLTEQLNWAFSNISGGDSIENYKASNNGSSSSESLSKEEEALNTFSEIKSLIIKSADIVEAYYKEFGVLLETEGKYMASSDFGTYYETSSKTLVDKYDSIEQQYQRLQEGVDEMGEVLGSVSTNALIKSGVLKSVTIGEYEGVPLYGIEIGQKVEDKTTGEVIYHKIAQLSSQGLELYANAGSSQPTAIFKYNTMYVPNADISGNLKLGGYKLVTDKGLTFKWAGRG